MSTTDARGHTVPEGTDPAARQSLLDLSLSIPSVAAAASETAANRHVQALIQAGVAVDGDHPVHVYRSDLGAIMTWNGTAWAWATATRATGWCHRQSPQGRGTPSPDGRSRSPGRR